MILSLAILLLMFLNEDPYFWNKTRFIRDKHFQEKANKSKYSWNEVEPWGIDWVNYKFKQKRTEKVYTLSFLGILNGLLKIIDLSFECSGENNKIVRGTSERNQSTKHNR